MPAFYTHYLIAQHALQNLDESLQEEIRRNSALYFFGAQGADFCFFYKLLPRLYKPRFDTQNKARRNLGSYIHREGGYDAVCIMKRFAKRDPAYLAYALGYLTHYATDVCFHPFVYEQTGTSLLSHSRLEHAFDGYFRNRYPVEQFATRKFPREKLSENERSLLFTLYATITENAGFPTLDKTEFYRSLTAFNATLPTAFRFFYGFSREKVFRYGDFAETLYQNACEFCDELFSLFLSALAENTELPYEYFGKNYLTGE